ncbi:MULTISPECIES: flavin reductase family protein [Ramlibacter]|uniref:Flavin reductase n=1 Tax=Ramlibacter pinisoli TaxID=2682844 RepID=A0A6N8IWZ9_9BURK|nr:MULTISPECIES: flavin reductase family protein [Ramlibacter]MBA2965540.1 flavin reductase family protein [Ramlibacter sp. CGMCC 1.13660]MVQ30506.1 flavin reductase [Ramlibacter pinisoli]
MQAHASAIDPGELRRAFGSFVTGVTIVTALDAGGRPVGLTANSFASVSLEPPLVLWSQSLTAPSHPVFRGAERFAINILADDQAGLSDRFARGGTDKFSGVTVREGLGGVPLIDGAAALLECIRVATYPGGDHAIFLGRVERFERHGRAPLVFAAGAYHAIGAPGAARSPALHPVS